MTTASAHGKLEIIHVFMTILFPCFCLFLVVQYLAMSAWVFLFILSNSS